MCGSEARSRARARCAVSAALRSEFSVKTKAALDNTPDTGLLSHRFAFATELIECNVENAALDSQSGAYTCLSQEICDIILYNCNPLRITANIATFKHTVMCYLTPSL